MLINMVIQKCWIVTAISFEPTQGEEPALSMCFSHLPTYELGLAVRCQISAFGSCSSFQFSNGKSDAASVSQPWRAASCENEQHVSVKVTCAEKSMSLGSCSLHPVSLFRKSSRLPEDKTEQETMSVFHMSAPMWALEGCMLNYVHVSCDFNRWKAF